MDNVLVSVIIPAFNAEADIGEALQSVLVQTHQSIEVIVVDDGSSDDTGAIVEKFVRMDARVQLMRQCNLGVGAARNAGIRKARGKYIAPLDADDLWFPEKLEEQVARMERCGDKTGLVYCWSTLIDERGDFVHNGSQTTVEGRLRHAMVMRNIVENASIPLFRAGALEKVGLYLTRDEQGGAQGCEDWDLNLRIAENFSIGVVPKYLVAYRQTSSSMSMQAESMAASYGVFISRARQRNWNLPSATFRWSGGGFYLYLADKCYHWGHYSRFFRYLKEAICANPVLLLNAGIYRILLKRVFNIFRVSIGNRIVEAAPSSAEKIEKRVNFDHEKGRKRPSILNMVFRHIESTQWSAALNDESLIDD